ncbi:MAG TPA: tetratricopeptide repeat protein [Candidatus Omnitrophota bacterium]|nr:tetratricopeptide repeat protein [Candidatus Omnitrophota bacterium]HQL41979.1 tetratricopeptide repeat protein [Candidatus Omnitrophota bacterium]
MKHFCHRWIVMYLLVLMIFFVFFREEPVVAKLSSIAYKKRLEAEIVHKINENQDFTAYELRWCIQYYQELIDTLGPFDHAYANQGFCYYYLGDLDRAIAMYDKAITINPNQYSYYWDQGMIYSQKKEFEKAIFLLQKAIDVLPKTVGMYAGFLRNDDFREAMGPQIVLEDFMSFLTRTREDEYLAYEELANIFLSLGREAVAQQMHRAAQGILTKKEDNKLSLAELYDQGFLFRRQDQRKHLHFHVLCFQKFFVNLQASAKRK